MAVRRRPLIAVGAFVVLAVLVAGAHWYQRQRGQLLPPLPTTTSAKPVETHVTNAGDRGPGSLREALFIVAAATGPSRIIFDVPGIHLESALPALVNGRGVHLLGQATGTVIDAQALSSGPVLDVSGPDTTIEALHFSSCPAAAILVRTVRFRLTNSTIDSCEVGVDIAGNASEILLERNHFINNRIAVRFGASGHNSALANNEFQQDRDAGVWAVRSALDSRDDVISIHDNKFTDEGTAVVAGNIPVVIEQNDFINARESAVHIVGAGTVVRRNHINGGAAMGVVVEGARNAVIDDNELEGLAAYGVLVRSSANVSVTNNRLHSCGYGFAFVLNDARAVSNAIGNTIIEPKYNGIDVIGDSPILRRNSVLHAHAFALNVEDFRPPGGTPVTAQPFLDNNNFGSSPIKRAGTAAAAQVSVPSH